MSGSWSLVSEVTGTAGALWVACRQAFWAAGVWASRAMAAATLSPMSGSRAVVVLVAADRLSANGWVAQVISIFESESVSLVILLCAVSGEPRPRVQVWVQSSEYSVWVDWASASRSLHRLFFHVQYLTAGGGCIVRCDSEASD